MVALLLFAWLVSSVVGWLSCADGLESVESQHPTIGFLNMDVQTQKNTKVINRGRGVCVVIRSGGE